MRADVALGQTTTTDAATNAARRKRPLWQITVAAWVGQRLLIGALVAIWQVALHTFSFGAFYRVWTLWDGVWYSLIARYWYRIIPQAAYFPLYPLLMRVTAPLLGGRVTLAGVLLNNGFSLAAFILVGSLVSHEFGARVARRTLLYYALFPTGLFFAAVYTEGLFLLLSVGAFVGLRQRRWGLAGALITLATLTRAQGALLLLPLLIEAWRAIAPEWQSMTLRRKARVGLELAGATIAPLLAFLCLQLYLAGIYHVPNVLSRAADYAAWQRYPDWPWSGIVSDIITLASGDKTYTLQVIKDLLFLAFWLSLCLIMLTRFRPRLPFSWVAYSWVSLLEVLILRAHAPGDGLMSVPRYILVVFPCFVMMALIGERYPRAHRLMVALSIAWVIIVTRLLVEMLFIA